MSVTYAVYKNRLRASKKFPTKEQAVIQAYESDLVLRGRHGNYLLEGVEIRELGEPSLADLGYASGNYTIRCRYCSELKNDCQKRAIMCRQCAQEKLDRWRDTRCRT